MTKHTKITIDASNSPLQLVPYSKGRLYTQTRTLGLSETSFDNAMRFDTVARLTQDIAAADMADAGLEDQGVWVVRRTYIRIFENAKYRDNLTISTFCAGLGRAWAQRRTDVTLGDTTVAQVSSLWIQTDPQTRTPKSLTPEFQNIFAESAGERKVTHRLEIVEQPSSKKFDWHWRIADFDLLGHLNNAVYFEVGEELLAKIQTPAIDRRGLSMIAEYKEGINLGQSNEIRLFSSQTHDAQFDFIADGLVQAGLYLITSHEK